MMDGHNIEIVHMFFSGNCGTGKSHLVKVIYNVISKTLLYHYKDSEKPRVLLLGPIWISPVNVGGTTIHFGLGINPGTKLLGLMTNLRNVSLKMKFLIMSELSIVWSDLWTVVVSILGEIFIMIPEKAFFYLSIMTIADLLQLPPIRGKLIFSQFSVKTSMKHLLGLQSWHLNMQN